MDELRSQAEPKLGLFPVPGFELFQNAVDYLDAIRRVTVLDRST